MISVRLSRLFLVLLTITHFSLPAWSNTVVVKKKSSIPVAELVEQILPYTYLTDANQRVLVRPGNPKVLRIRETSKEIRVTYNRKFDEALKNRPFAATDILMLLTKGFADFLGEDPASLLAGVLALKGVNRRQIIFYSNKIKKDGFPWLDKSEMEDLLEFHKELRQKMLKPKEETIATPLVEPPPVETGEVVAEEPVVVGEEILEAPVVIEEAGGIGDGDWGFGDGDPNNSAVKVYYATNRQKYPEVINTPKENIDPNEFYSGIPEVGNKLNYGYTTVNIPKIHKKGAVERPSIMRLEFWKPPVEDPQKHVMLTKIQELNRDQFLKI